jgi:MYXO-CTERM domain-containing protein
LGIAGASLLVPSTAQAHFTLDYPPSWTVDSDTLGDPQKAYPCGVLPTDTYTPSNTIMAFSPGQTITVKWTEEIAHDGWFRIALSYANGAESQSTTDFPEPSYQTTNGALGTLSVDAGIENPAVPPVLADGLWPHAASSVSTPKQYTQAITLPTKPCAKCVLQLLQIMLNHPVNAPNNVPGAGFTYHHCAFISIESGADGGTQTLPEAGVADAKAEAGGHTSGGSGGCSLSTPRESGGGPLAALAGLALAAAFVRRRRRIQGRQSCRADSGTPLPTMPSTPRRTLQTVIPGFKSHPHLGRRQASAR